MPKFIHDHPCIIGFLIAYLILFFVGVFALDFSWSESLLAAAVLSAVGVGASGGKWRDLGRHKTSIVVRIANIPFGY